MFPAHSAAETARRRDKLFSLLAKQKIDAALFDRAADQFYFTGYTGAESWLLAFAKSRKLMLITDARYTEEAERSAPGTEVVRWKDSPGRHAAALLKKRRVKALGFTPTSLTAEFYQALLANRPWPVRFHGIDPEVMALRAVKSASEVAAIRKAIVCAETAFTEALPGWKPGMTEADVALDLDFRMRRLGATGPAFTTIAASGANASLPHAHAGGRKISPGRMLLLDFGATVAGYSSDMTRTLWCGDIPRVWRKRYVAVLAANRAGLAAIGPGAQAQGVHQAAMQPLLEAGIAEYFTHGLGHGVGLAVHEEPRLGSKSESVLAPGHIVTVEPGVYFPGSGGIRVEDMALVTAAGGETLTSLPKGLETAVF